MLSCLTNVITFFDHKDKITEENLKLIQIYLKILFSFPNEEMLNMLFFVPTEC